MEMKEVTDSGDFGDKERPQPIDVEIPAGLEDLVPDYLEARRKEVSEMTALLAASDYSRLSKLGHNLKGTARGYGFPDLVPIGAALERCADRMDGEMLRAQLTGLGSYLDRVRLVPRAA